MTSPQRVRLSRRAGWRKPVDTIVVARPSKWGNPWATVRRPDGHWTVAHRTTDPDPDPVLYPTRSAAAVVAVAHYRAWLDAMPAGQRASLLEPLRGHHLACWCPLEHACHADVLLDLANRKEPA